MEQNFRSVSLNAKLIDEVEQYIKDTRSYRSIAEFVNETLRLRLKELKGD